MRRVEVLIAFLILTASAVHAAPPDKRLQWDKKWGPMVPHKNFPKDCSLCHVPKRWDVLRSDFKFDHQKETGFPLVGAHAGASCLRCHNDRGPLKVYLSRGCGGCHVDPHKSSLGFNCTRCHDQTSWIKQGHLTEKVADHSRTRFPLTGVHASLQCQQCHTRAEAGDFRGAALDCASCHQRDFAKGANHVAMSFPRTCESCHTTALWAGARFNHNAFGGNLACVNCHVNEFKGAPNHVAQSYPQTCQNCHNTATWLSARGAFDHTTLGANPNCVGCHQPDFNSAKATPASNHTANAFPTTCQNCHNTTAFGPGTAMKHQLVSAACATCHTADFQRAPNHVAQSYPQTCQSCHTTDTWLASGGVFNHAALGANPNCVGCHQAAFNTAKATPASNHTANAFPTSCQNCHNTTAFGPGTTMKHQFVTSAACATCHMGDFNLAKATLSSNHSANGFPTSCQNCHNTTTFGPGTTMQHNMVTGVACYNCHRDDYNATNNPPHAANGYGTTCTTCHSSVTTWAGAVFNHTAFRLPHNGATCTDCHAGGNTALANCSCAKCHGTSQRCK